MLGLLSPLMAEELLSIAAFLPFGSSVVVVVVAKLAGTVVVVVVVVDCSF